MRVVDINGVSEPAGLAVDEVWWVDSRARRDNPARFDAQAVAINTGPAVRPFPVVMPGPADELERRLSTYRGAGAPAVVRICPGPNGHGFPLTPWAVSPIPEYCEREEVAVAVDFGTSVYPWAEVVQFARDYPRLPIIALGCPLSGPTPARALDAAPNLILETSAIEDQTNVANMIRSHGAYRFVYGSGAGKSPYTVIASSLSAADAEIVLSATADQLATGKWAATHL